MQQHGAEEGRVGGWYLFPPPPDYVDELKKQEKFLLISDAGGTNSESFSVNVMGMAIGLIILLFFVQLAMPGIRQVGDFIAAIYSPYTTYGVDEVSRYDTFYGDYGVDNRRHSPQYRNFEEAKDLLTNIVNNGEDGPAARNSVRDAGARNPVLEASRPQASSPGLDPASLIN